MDTAIADDQSVAIKLRYTYNGEAEQTFACAITECVKRIQ